jgi:hypothetical protein
VVRASYDVGSAALFGEAGEALRNALDGVQAELEAFASELVARRPAARWRSSGLTVNTYRDYVEAEVYGRSESCARWRP